MKNLPVCQDVCWCNDNNDVSIPNNFTDMILSFRTLIVFIVYISTSYGLSVTWSNRIGSTLISYGKDIYAAERPFVWNNIDVGGRSVIIKLSDKSLFVHSPVAITPDLKGSLKQIGNVGHVVSSNYEHLKYAKMWEIEYPNAKRYACPGLTERMPEVQWYTELGGTEIPRELMNDFEIIHMNCEINPITSKPFFNEVIFYHKQSKSLLVTDLFWNYPSQSLPNYHGIEGTGSYLENNQIKLLPKVKMPFGTKLWKFGMDKLYLPIYKSILVGLWGERRKRYHEIVKKIIELDIEMILPCHGDVIKGKNLCKTVLRNFLS